MAENITLMGIFREVDQAATTLDGLRELGIRDQDITILSSLPYSAEMLGRPHHKTKLPLISLISAALGLLVGIFYNVVTPHLYTLYVGGQPIVPGPPTTVLLYEFTMIFLILGTFLAVVWLNEFPARKPDYFHPSLVDGRIGVIFSCPVERKEAAWSILETRGAERIEEPERRAL